MAPKARGSVTPDKVIKREPTTAVRVPLEQALAAGPTTSNPSGSVSETAWSPDGRKIAFQSNRDGNFEIYVITARSGE